MATFYVVNSNDSGEGSLRDAISQANANLGKDDIFVQTDVTLTKSIKISDSVSIGTPYGASITQTGNNERIFTIDDNTEDAIGVNLFRLDLTGGNSDFGGAILSREDLNITDSEIYNNTVTIRGAGICQLDGSLSLERTLVYDNKIINSDSKDLVGGIFSDSEPNLINAIVDIESTDSNSDTINVNVEIVEFYHFYELEKDRHFYTIDSNEANHLFDDPFYSFESEFKTIASNKDTLTGANIEGVQEVYRFFNEDTGTHFYTIDRVEKDYIINNLNNYSYEDIGFYAFETKPENISNLPIVPVYRSQNYLGTHIFTIDSTEIQSESLTGEGDAIAFYVFGTEIS